MAEMDLIPVEFRRTLRLHRLLRHFFLACLIVVLGVSLTWAALRYLISSEKSLVAHLQQQESIAQANKAKEAALRQQKSEVEARLAALTQLRSERQAFTLLSAIDKAYREGIWLDSMHFLHRARSSSTPDAVKTAGINVVPNTTLANNGSGMNQSMNIVGHALNHSQLAEFMGKLEAQPGISSLHLVDTKLRDYLTTQVVDFTLNLQVGNKAAQP